MFIHNSPVPSGKDLTKEGNILMSAVGLDFFFSPFFISSLHNIITCRYVADGSLNPFTRDSIWKKRKKKKQKIIYTIFFNQILNTM